MLSVCNNELMTVAVEHKAVVQLLQLILRMTNRAEAHRTIFVFAAQRPFTMKLLQSVSF